MEAAGDAAESVVLGHTCDGEQGFRGFLGPNGGAVCEDWKDNGVVDPAPVGIVQSPDGIPQDVQRADGGAGPVSHDLNVVGPV